MSAPLVEVVVVCGAGTAADALVPVVGADTWARDPDAVQRACDELRVRAATEMPGARHEAIARLQQVLGAERCAVATTAVDGLLQKAGAEEVVELRGSLFRLVCAADPDHPMVPVFGVRRGVERCEECGGPLRPDLALPGERHRAWEPLVRRIRAARRVLLVELDDVVAEALARAARQGTETRSVGIGSGSRHADVALGGPVDEAVPHLVEEWLS